MRPGHRAAEEVLGVLKCPTCGGASSKAIYYGLPVMLCTAGGDRPGDCNAMWANPLWEWLVYSLPFNGWFMLYSGGYLPALWHWLADG